MDWPILAVDKVLFAGQYVAAIAADSPEAAAAAALAIDVRYEELPGIFQISEALAPGAPVLHEHPNAMHFSWASGPAVAHPNMQGQTIVQRGDVDAAFARCARTFEHRFTTPRHHAGHIEPHACTVWIDAEDRVHVITTNKSPFPLRAQLAKSIGVPLETVIIETAFIGGDFGGKGLSVDEFGCYFLAAATDRPIKFARRHLDDVRSTNVRHAADIRMRTGLSAGGSIEAMDISVTYDGGAFAAGKPLKSLVPRTLAQGTVSRRQRPHYEHRGLHEHRPGRTHSGAGRRPTRLCARIAYRHDCDRSRHRPDRVSPATRGRRWRSRFSRRAVSPTARTRSPHGARGSIRRAIDTPWSRCGRRPRVPPYRHGRSARRITALRRRPARSDQRRHRSRRPARRRC